MYTPVEVALFAAAGIAAAYAGMALRAWWRRRVGVGRDDEADLFI